MKRPRVHKAFQAFDRGREQIQAGACSLLFALACSSAPPPQAQSADPPLEDSGAAPGATPQVAPASSEKVQQGIDAIQRGDFAAAKAALSEARTSAPKDPQAAFYLGVACEQLGDAAAAEKEYRSALELDPKLSDASANLSALLLDASKADEALPIIDQGLRAAPKHPDLLMNRALALETAGRRPDAVKAYAAAVKARPDNMELRLAYAQLLMQSDQGSQALEEVRSGARSEDPKLLIVAADLFGKLKAPADCIAALDRVLKSRPSPPILVRRGACRHAANDEAGAQADFEAALKLDARFAAAHYYLGMHLEKRDKKAAVGHLQKAVEIDGESGAVGKHAKLRLAELKKKR